MFERGPGLPVSEDDDVGVRARAGAPVKASPPTGMLEDVRWGLSQPQKQLPSKYFYDTRGSELFEAITELPEYYPTRTETGLLKTPVSGWVTEMAPASLVELGGRKCAEDEDLARCHGARDTRADLRARRRGW